MKLDFLIFLSGAFSLRVSENQVLLSSLVETSRASDPHVNCGNFKCTCPDCNAANFGVCVDQNCAEDTGTCIWYGIRVLTVPQNIGVTTDLGTITTRKACADACTASGTGVCQFWHFSDLFGGPCSQLTAAAATNAVVTLSKNDASGTDHGTVGRADCTGLTIGDPHVTNSRGQEFDILALGSFTFLKVWSASETPQHFPQLILNAVVDRTSQNCASTYITNLTVGGDWVRKQGYDKIQIRASDKGTVEVGLDEKWVQTSLNDNTDLIFSTATFASIKLNQVNIKVTGDAHWGWNFLNLQVVGISELEKSFQISGLLVNDDITEVVKSDGICSSFMRGSRQQMLSNANIA